MGWVWGAGPPQLFSSTWGASPHRPTSICRHLLHGSASGRREVGCTALRCLPGFACLLACLLACRESLQSLQSSWCRSQFTPPVAPNKLLQKQPGGSNALSGECSHLTKKEPFSDGFPNINTLKPLTAPSDLAVSVPCQENCCFFPVAPHKALQPVSVLQMMAWS